MPIAKLDGIDLYYEQGGAGARLLFLNGTGGDLRQKPSLIEGPLAAEFEILAHDQRGLGQSGKPDRPYSMANYADDAAALLDHVGWDRCHVFGVSFGGMVGQELALRHPDRIERLVLCCTSSGGAGGASYPLHELQGLPPKEHARRVLELGDQRWAEGAAGRTPARFEKMVEFMMSRFTEEAPAEERAATEVGARRQLEARLGHDTWDRLAEIGTPTLLCGGRYDGISPPANMENLHSRLPQSELEFFDGGHMFLLEDRAAFRRVIAFLNGDSGGRD
ncbi:MAG: alpha/beta fold hydrolase [Myxococcota bacterium]